MYVFYARSLGNSGSRNDVADQKLVSKKDPLLIIIYKGTKNSPKKHYRQKG
jgi:hypothetical protein